MIHDIYPKTFDNQYVNKNAAPEDLFLFYHNDEILVKENMGKLWYPAFLDFEKYYPDIYKNARYLFSIDNTNFFLILNYRKLEAKGWTYVSDNSFRTEVKYWRSYAGVVGWQLNRWYNNHKFCSKCGRPTKNSNLERIIYCDHCKFYIYPDISPCVIVAVHNKDKLLLTKYARGTYNRYALIAGFAEIGESLEQTVHREVMEEVGLKVKNLKFYKSQPWPFTDTLLAGFFAELDGDDKIILDKDELALGVWLKRDEIPPAESNISLTSEMMEVFRKKAIDL